MSNPIENEVARGHFRVHTRIPVRHYAAKPAELDELRAQIEQCTAQQIAGATQDTNARLGHLERKLDHILSLLTDDHPTPVLSSDIKDVQLSATGIGYHSDDPPAVDSLVVCELLLPGLDPMRIRSVARIVRAEPSQRGGADLGLHFETIATGDQDAIVRFANRVQIQEGR